MRTLVQRVRQAKVVVGGETTGEIGHGLLVFLGIHKEDTEKEIPWMVNKLLNLRIFSDDAGKMNRSVQDVNGDILVVSQFTLYGNCKNGRRPEFTQSASGQHAEDLYNRFCEAVEGNLGSVATGRFAAHMEVSLTNDGPVTLMIDSKH
jgi:D-tyrosyl-tRNA(Tyr) deacylase